MGYDEVVLKVTHGEHRVKRSWNKNFDYVVDVGIPKINLIISAPMILTYMRRCTF